MKKTLPVLIIFSLFLVIYSKSCLAVIEQSSGSSLLINKTSEAKNLTSKIYQNLAGEKTLMAIGPQGSIPLKLAKDYMEVKSAGYIVLLKQDSLIIKGLKLSKEKNKTLILNELSNQKRLIDLEQKQVEIAIKSLSPQVSITRKFSKTLNGLVVQNLTDKDALNLRNKGYIVSPNYEVKAQLDQAESIIGAPSVWQNLKDNQGQPITGKNIKIGILDTGVSYLHPDLGGCFGINCKVVGGYDFVNNDFDPQDDHGHGTHVAAIAAGNGVFKGVAPDAKIYAYKVLNEDGGGYSDAIIAALEEAVDPNKDGDFSDKLDVVNLSLGGNGDPDDPISLAVDKVVDLGLVVSVAAGNSGDSKTIKSPGTARKAITVGAFNKKDELAAFSSRGPVIWNNQTLVKPDLVAPGVSICAAEYNTWLGGSRCKDNQHIAISGTSMATPFVTGSVALIKQLHPDWTPEEIKSLLKNNVGSWLIRDGVKQIDKYNPLEQGNGRLNIFFAANSLKPTVIQLDPLDLIKEGRLSIKGRIQSPSFKSFSLSYRKIDNWQNSNYEIVAKSDKLPIGSQLGELNLSILSNGKYVLQVGIEEKSGKKYYEYGYFEVQRQLITNPLNNDIYRSGEIIPIQLDTSYCSVKTDCQVKTTEYYYGQGQNPSIFIKINSSNWNTENLATGYYSIKVILKNYFAKEKKNVTEEFKIFVYLDKTLKAGFPQRIKTDKCVNEDCDIWPGLLEPVTVDLNNDGEKEILVFSGGNPPKLYAYKQDGNLLWIAKVGSESYPGGNLKAPLVGDINNDGKDEIFVVIPYLFNGLTIKGEIYSFNNQGQPLANFPQPLNIAGGYSVGMSMVDINSDGFKEIIFHAENQGIGIIDHLAKLLEFQLPMTHLTVFPPSNWAYPSIADLNNDGKLEIVVANLDEYQDPSDSIMNNGTIYALTSDGKILPGWPVQIKGLIRSAPSIGDINNDGKLEIVIASDYLADSSPDSNLGGLYVLDNQGKILPGWPQAKGVEFLSSVALGDLNNDKNLEIAVSGLDSNKNDDFTYVFDYKGDLLPGWPKADHYFHSDFYSPFMTDINNDNLQEVLITVGGSYSPLVPPKTGVHAYNLKGEVIANFPKLIENCYVGGLAIFPDKNNQTLIAATSNDDFDIYKTVSNDRSKHRSSIYIWEMNNQFSNGEWPAMHHDFQRTGLYTYPDKTAKASTIQYVGQPQNQFSLKDILNNFIQAVKESVSP